MPDTPVIGHDCKAYYNSAGNHATPTWVEIADAQDVRITDEWGEAELLTRSSDFAKVAATVRRITIEIDYVFAAGTTVWKFLLDAYEDKDITEFAIMDGAIATADQQGLRAFCQIMSMSIEQPLEGWATATFTMKPAYFVESAAVVNPDWYVVAGA